MIWKKKIATIWSFYLGIRFVWRRWGES